MFTKSAEYYDELYAVRKDYRAEARQVHMLIRRHKRAEGNRLLDVGCGTGIHAALLSRQYHVEGLDLDPQMLAVARRKHPRLRFHRGDMVDFELGRQFDAIVSLFSAIGYVRTKARLQRAIRNMAVHLVPGGVLLVEPWFTPARWKVGQSHMSYVDRPDLKLVRVSYSGRRGRVSLLEFHYLIGTTRGVQHAVEHHELGLFTRAEYLQAFRLAGLQVIHDPRGLDERGLYIGLKG
jgi:SAM-dependent methyltransferase